MTNLLTRRTEYRQDSLFDEYESTTRVVEEKTGEENVTRFRRIDGQLAFAALVHLDIVEDGHVELGRE